MWETDVVVLEVVSTAEDPFGFLWRRRCEDDGFAMIEVGFETKIGLELRAGRI